MISSYVLAGTADLQLNLAWQLDRYTTIGTLDDPGSDPANIGVVEPGRA